MVDQVVVAEAEDGARLDRWLKKKYPDMTFSNLQKLLRTGQLRVDGKRAKGDTRLVAGQEVRIPPQLAAAVHVPGKKRTLSEKDMDLIKSLVIYQDKDIIAINKPAGLATQGGSKITRHIDGLVEGLADESGHKPHLVHRLDKDTSGVMVLARNAKAAKALGSLFSGRDIRKYYWAITVPAPLEPQGKIRSYLAKTGPLGNEKVHPVSEDHKDGKLAVTYYQVLETAHRKLALVAFWPRTGRTHQIRVHALEMGCPLLGDHKYAFDQPILDDIHELPDMLHLHARRIIFRHPFTGKKVDITAPLDPEMRKTWKYFSFDANDKNDPFEDVE